MSYTVKIRVDLGSSREVAREAGRTQRAGRGDGGERGAQGGRGEQRRQHLVRWVDFGSKATA